VQEHNRRKGELTRQSLALACPHRGPYDRFIMSESIDLSDPSFEPSDEQLEGLSKRAFAGVAASHAAALARLRADVAEARKATLIALEKRGGRAGT
jgi:hypothetical protein